MSKDIVRAKVLTVKALKAALIAKVSGKKSAIFASKASFFRQVSTNAAAVSNGILSSLEDIYPWVYFVGPVVPDAAASAAIAGLGALASPFLAPLSLLNSRSTRRGVSLLMWYFTHLLNFDAFSMTDPPRHRTPTVQQ